MSWRTSLHRLLPKLWQQRNLIAALLLPWTVLYRAIASVHRGLYRSGIFKIASLPVPVIVVGNITVGGSGKTPLVLWLFEALRAAGKNPGIISRGYGGSGSAAGMLVFADTSPTQGGDEPCLLAQHTGQAVAIGRDRVAAARLLLSYLPACDVLISDDGLQHLRLPRAFEIAVLDTRNIGNGWQLPAGPLRESSARLQQVDAIVLNGLRPLQNLMTTPQFHMQLCVQATYQLIDPTQQRHLATFRPHTILAAAGIGNPARFFNLLRDQGLSVETLALPDHYDFSSQPFARHPAQIILITEKDAVKCRALGWQDARIWVVPVRATVQATQANRPALSAAILQRLAAQ